jgi:hypothetical protein
VNSEPLVSELFGGKPYVRAELIQLWLEEHKTKDAPVGSSDESWVFGIFFDLTHERPEEAWSLIQELITHELTEWQEAALAAGPMEDLLAMHGELFIDRVEMAARRDPKFRHLLGGVWQSSITDTLWQRIKRCRDTVW